MDGSVFPLDERECCARSASRLERHGYHQRAAAASMIRSLFTIAARARLRRPALSRRCLTKRRDRRAVVLMGSETSAHNGAQAGGMSTKSPANNMSVKDPNTPRRSDQTGLVGPACAQRYALWSPCWIQLTRAVVREVLTTCRGRHLVTWSATKGACMHPNSLLRRSRALIGRFLLNASADVAEFGSTAVRLRGRRYYGIVHVVK
jgi:hypothetical protein